MTQVDAKTLEIIEFFENRGVKKSTVNVVCSIYRLKETPFIGTTLNDLAVNILKEAEFEMMNEDFAYIFAALLIADNEYPFSKIQPYIELLHEVHKAGFQSTVSNFMAYALMYVENPTKYIYEAKTIYRHMQGEHAFLTGEEDFLLAQYLACTDRPVEALIFEAEYYYDALLGVGFRRGNALQFLAHQLVLFEQFDNKEIWVNKAFYIYNGLKSQKMKIKRVHMMMIGLAAFYINPVDELLKRYIASSDELKTLSTSTDEQLRTIDRNGLSTSKEDEAYLSAMLLFKTIVNMLLPECTDFYLNLDKLTRLPHMQFILMNLWVAYTS